MAENESRVVVEVPTHTPLPITHYSIPNKLDQFRQGWINAIALPDNPTDLIFDVTASVTIPALVSSCWASFPLPDFLRLGGLLAITLAALVVWKMLAIAEIRGYLILRLILLTVGVVMGL